MELILQLIRKETLELVLFVEHLKLGLHIFQVLQLIIGQEEK